jgi:Bacterial regulatory proteins, luxR family
MGRERSCHGTGRCQRRRDETNAEIASELFLSKKTIETHIRNMFGKLDANSRVEIARAVQRAEPLESTLVARTVIWATGFGVDYSYVGAPVFRDDGAVIHARGVTAAPGLNFLGMPWQPTRGSALLGWVKDDARHTADQISKLASVPVERLMATA